MKAKWIVHNHKKDLLLFLNGWGMDERPFHFLSSERFDVLMLHDYQNLDLPQDWAAWLAPYREVYVLAWSLGVWVSQSLKDWLPKNTAFTVAINGTLQPIHPRYGIAPGIFNSTVQQLTPATRDTFYRNMFMEDTDAARFLLHTPERTFANQAEELQQLQRLILAEQPPRETMGFDMAIISSYDLIMPSKNQLRFWKNQSTCQMIKAGHFPFYQWRTWEDIFVYVTHE